VACLCPLEDFLEQRVFDLIEVFECLQVVALSGLLLERIQGDAGAQELFGVVQAGELVERCLHVLVPVDALDAAWLFGVVDVGREQAGAVEVEQRIEVFGAEGIEAFGVALRDMGMAERFADDRTVFALDQGIVIAFPGTAFGELDVQFGEQVPGPVVDVLTAVVGMEADDVEGKLGQHVLDEREQECLGDGLNRPHDLPLGHTVHRIDVIQPLGPVEVALMDGIDADEAGPLAGVGRAAEADGRCLARGLGSGLDHALSLIERTAAQVVQVRDRERAQAHEARIPAVPHPAQDATHGRAGERLHLPVHLGQQRDIGGRIAAGER